MDVHVAAWCLPVRLLNKPAPQLAASGITRGILPVAVRVITRPAFGKVTSVRLQTKPSSAASHWVDGGTRIHVPAQKFKRTPVMAAIRVAAANREASFTKRC
jgi:hypothetical protein